MKQTDTPAFRRWFRNSVVVNEDGSPMVVYHGTRSAEPFTQFDLSKTRELGFHFGTRSQARDFTEGFVPDYPGAKLFAPRIYPVYLSIQKPFCMPDVFAGSTIMFNAWLQADSMSRVGTAPDSNFWKFCTESTIRRHHQMVVDALRKELGSEWVDATWADFRSVLTRLGFDGVVYHNIAEGDSRRSDNIAWIVWNPTQIKSAIGNRGTFDPDDPVITNPVLPPELGRLIEVGDTVLNYDSAQGEDFYDLYDLVYTRRRPTTGEIEEVAGMLNDNGVFAVLSGDTRDLGKYFQKVGVLGTVAVAQGPKNPEVSRINAEKKRRKM